MAKKHHNNARNRSNNALRVDQSIAKKNGTPNKGAGNNNNKNNNNDKNNNNNNNNNNGNNQSDTLAETTEKLNNECVQKNVKELLENDLSCAICRDTYINPVILNCSHSFCKFCLNAWLAKQDQCPSCRIDAIFHTENSTLRDLVEKMINKMPAQYQALRKAATDARVKQEETQEKQMAPLRPRTRNCERRTNDASYNQQRTRRIQRWTGLNGATVWRTPLDTVSRRPANHDGLHIDGDDLAHVYDTDTDDDDDDEDSRDDDDFPSYLIHRDHLSQLVAENQNGRILDMWGGRFEDDDRESDSSYDGSDIERNTHGSHNDPVVFRSVPVDPDEDDEDDEEDDDDEDDDDEDEDDNEVFADEVSEEELVLNVDDGFLSIRSSSPSSSSTMSQSTTSLSSSSSSTSESSMREAEEMDDDRGPESSADWTNYLPSDEEMPEQERVDEDQISIDAQSSSDDDDDDDDDDFVMSDPESDEVGGRHRSARAPWHVRQMLFGPGGRYSRRRRIIRRNPSLW